MGGALADLEELGAIEAGPTFVRWNLGEDFDRQTWLATEAGRGARMVYCGGERALAIGGSCSRCGAAHPAVTWEPSP
jgi:hypothetical protein